MNNVELNVLTKVYSPATEKVGKALSTIKEIVPYKKVEIPSPSNLRASFLDKECLEKYAIQKNLGLYAGNEEKIIAHGGGQFLPVNIEHIKSYQEDYLKTIYPKYSQEDLYQCVYSHIFGLEKEIPKDIIKEFETNSGAVKQGLKDFQDKFIQENVEIPCRKLTRRLLDQEKRPYWSNAFGHGHKGVYWEDLKTKDKFLTCLDGKTYKVKPENNYCFLELESETPISKQKAASLNLDFSGALPTLKDFQ